MSFTPEIDDYAAQAAEKAAEALPSGDFPPVPKGAYQAIILENKGVEELTKDPTNRNYGKKVVKLHVQVDQNSPTAAGRHYFVRVPLFSRFAPNPNAKNDESKTIGAPARMFFNFFQNVMGVPLADILAKKPLPSNVEGRRLTIILGAPKAPDQHNALGSNEIDGVDAPQDDFANTPTLLPGATVAPWLTPEGGLNPSWTPPVQGGGVPGIGGGVPQLPGAGVPGIGGGVPQLPGAGVPQVAPLQTGYAPQPGGVPAYAGVAPTGHQAAPPAGYAAGGSFPGHVVPQDTPQAPGTPLAQPAQVQVPSTVPAAWAGPAASAAQAAVAGTGY
ncbi:hypothetical protein [Microbacterium sp. T32]|uniref:hypothetical protein n=1 Tax=Microbacterium sp. T32 TaxID=1776083 RepID=UPI0007ABDD88|nr:hypothetical protein [Microbacterium sp. T32]KZE41415.1 hypothetical protein AVW09_02165 [Microbacterium sp. T32]